MKKIVLFFWVVLLHNFAAASTIAIGIYSDFTVSSLVLSIKSGSYFILFDSTKKIQADTNSVYHLTLENDSIRIKTLGKDFGKFKRIDCMGNENAAIRLKSVTPPISAKNFEQDFSFYVLNNQLKIQNKVELEKYVAGVVEIEAGTRQTAEYYKVQAIICRTYALSNLRRHEMDNFNLCDNVHCQVYKGNSKANPVIGEAVKQTINLVLVDKKSELITTAFHSNCGGQTCNSEDVWGMKKPYLRSVQDTFCLRQRNAQWTKIVPLENWTQFLSQNCKPCESDSAIICCNFEQEQRKNFFEISSTQIPLKNIRNELKLKSSFFSINFKNDSLLFIGKGYGHGVGLCQEGAIQMAKVGLKYNSILHFYYQDVDIINLNQMHFFKE